MTSARLIERDELPALVRARGRWFYVLATHGELVLDYASYYPTYVGSPDAGRFQRGLLAVQPSDGLAYLAALGDRAFPLSSGPDFIDLNGSERARPVALVDFDAGRFVSSFFDQALEENAGSNWVASYGDPLGSGPAEASRLWMGTSDDSG